MSTAVKLSKIPVPNHPRTLKINQRIWWDDQNLQKKGHVQFSKHKYIHKINNIISDSRKHVLRTLDILFNI